MARLKVFLALLPALVAAVPHTKRTISNGPVIAANFPDPSWVQVGDTYYAFSTSSAGRNVQVATSPDFKTWTLLNGKDALPKLGPWGSDGTSIWAPDVVQLVPHRLPYRCSQRELEPD